MLFKTAVNWLFNDYDVIHSLLVLIEKLVFFNKQLQRFNISLNLRYGTCLEQGVA